MNYDAHLMVSGKKGSTFGAVVLLHLSVGYILYSGLSAKFSRHRLPPPLNVTEIQKTAEPIKIPPTALKFNDAKIDMPTPRDPPIDRDESSQTLSVNDLPLPSQDSNEAQPTLPVGRVKTPVRANPKHPLKVGPEYYPDGSIRNGEQGKCVVQITVGVNGEVKRAAIRATTGYRRLDDACLNAVRGARLLPATEDSKAVESTASIPILWTLNSH